MENVYYIPIHSCADMFSVPGPEATLAYSWFGGAPLPPTTFRMIFCPNSGFHILMHSLEIPDPCRFLSNDEPVHQDSCMEFFADFFPEQHRGYVNIETNAAGAMLCMFGATRENRQFTKEITTLHPIAKTEISDDGWRLWLNIPLEFIEALYGTSKFSPGHLIRGNFYKCGDKTSSPHWGSWNWLGDQPIDFHQPETFGSLILNKN